MSHLVSRVPVESIELRGIGLNSEGKDILKEVDLQIKLGTNYVFDGAPGSGRSVLLKIMAALVEPSKGDVLYNGKSLNDYTHEEFDLVRLSTGFVFDNGGLLSNRTLMDNIVLPLAYHGTWDDEGIRKKTMDLVGKFNLEPFCQQRPATVSVGIRKIAGLVRALALEPQILFMDEPSVGIGTEAVETLAQWIRERKQTHPDLTLLLASSDRDFLSKIDHIFYKVRDKHMVLIEEHKAA